MWYLVAFTTLLLIALILKHRESASNTGQRQKVALSKKRIKLKQKRLKKSTVVERQSAADDPILVASALATTHAQQSADFEQQLKTWLALNQLETAEIALNQKINLNPDQHSLYVWLIQVYQRQHDELAIQQLLQHLKQLGLEDTYQQALDLLDDHQLYQPRLSNAKHLVLANLEQPPLSHLSAHFERISKAESSLTEIPKVVIENSKQPDLNAQNPLNTSEYLSELKQEPALTLTNPPVLTTVDELPELEFKLAPAQATVPSEKTRSPVQGISFDLKKE